MPPDPPSSSFPEPPDPLALLDDAVWDLLGEAALPPMAGGAFPGFLEDAWKWTKENLLDPAGRELLGWLAEIGRTVIGAVTTLLAWVLKWVYHGVRWFLIGVIPEGYRGLYPSPFDEPTQGPFTYLSRIFNMLGAAVVGIVGDVAGWLWRAVAGHVEWAIREVRDHAGWLWRAVAGHVEWAIREVRDHAAWLWRAVWSAISQVWNWVSDAAAWLWRAVWSAISQVWNWVSDAAGWLWRAVAGHVEWAIREVRDAAGWLWNVVWDGARWVWAQVWAGLKWAWDNVLSKIPEGIVAGAAAIGGLIRDAFEWLVETAFKPVAEILARKLAIPGKLIRGGYETMGEWVDDLLDPPPLTNFIKFVAWIFVGFLSILIAFMPALSPINAKWAQQTHEIVRDRLLDSRTVIEASWRDYPVSHGYEGHLARLGYTSTDIITMLDLGDLIPGPSDLVRMGVREVFTPEIAERFGQFQDFPPAFGEWMAKQGYKPEWARNFWAGHWDLPSAMQAFEMFHRDVISEGDLKLLLRALDIMPYWRDKLKEIAYNPLTRVDVRRMYSAGVIDEAKVERTYRDQGYTPENARLLRQWVVKEFPRKDDAGNLKAREDIVSVTRQAYARRLISRDTTVDRLRDADYTADEAELQVDIWDFDFYLDPSLRSDVDPKQLGISVIERAYERRLVDFNAAVRELGELGYTPEDAKLRLQLVDLRLEENLADLEIEAALDEYYAGLIGDAQLAARLKDLHIPEARVDYLVREQILRRQVKDKQLTLSQLKRAVAADIIGVGEFRFRLDAMGYNSRDVNILVELEAGAV